MPTRTKRRQEFSLTRDRVARVLAMLDAKHANGGLNPDETKAHEVATLRLYGAGASPLKFARLDAQQVDGVLRGQYRFAGAGQTGRMTSRGAQIQNLTRDVLGKDGAAEAPLVDMIADGCSYAALAAAEPVDVPVARKLALDRPSRPRCERGKNIRLVGLYRRSRRGFRRGSPCRPTPSGCSTSSAPTIADPSRPDIYMIAAADILHKNDPSGITKSERQIGKVATLALGFGGSVGALQSMALNYRINLDDAEARRIVDAWREANPWAREFWNALWDAAMTAWEVPGQITTAGRIAFVYRDDYLGGVAVHGAAVGPAADLSAAALARGRRSRQGQEADRREAPRAVVPARPRARQAMVRHAFGKQRPGSCRRPACARRSRGSKPTRRSRSCRSA